MRKTDKSVIFILLLCITVLKVNSEQKMPVLQTLTKASQKDSTVNLSELITPDSAYIAAPSVRSVLSGEIVDVEIVPRCAVDSVMILVRHSENRIDSLGVVRRAPYKLKWDPSNCPDQDQIHLQFGYILYKDQDRKIICPPMPHRWVLDRDKRLSRKKVNCRQTTTPEKIKIDGDLSDWKNVREIRIGSEGTFRILWSNSHILFAAHVKDSSVTYSDFLELHFDLHNDKSHFSGINHRSIRFGPKTRSNSFTVDLTKDGFILSDSINVLLSREMKWARSFIDGYTIEASIPFFCLSDLQFPNMKFGFDVSILNSDNDGTRRFTSWSGSTFSNRYNPSQWGTIRLKQAFPLLKFLLALSAIITGAIIAFVITILIKQCRDDYKYEELENKGTSELMSSILESMRRMISNSELDLEVFSKKTGIDREKIESEIQAETGCDFTSLLTFERIRSVKELLRDTDIPFEEIAAKAGFTDLDNMRTTFEQITCTTPEKYRERIKEEENSEEE